MLLDTHQGSGIFQADLDKVKGLLLLVPFIVLSFSSTCLAQDTTLIWINYKDEEVPKQVANLYRLTWPEGDHWRVLDHYLDGTLQMSGGYETRDFENRTGFFEYYSKDGGKILECTYLNNQLIGAFQSWYEDGSHETLGTYANDFDRVEAANANDTPRQGYPVKYVHADSLSIKIGKWSYFYQNGQLSAVEEYDSTGTRLQVDYFEPDGSKSPEDAIIERMPEFPGGETELMQFLGKHIRYPKKDKRKNIQGKVLAKFDVDRNGSVQNMDIVKSLSPLIDAECIRVINLMPDWKPGRAFNRNVKVTYFLPVQFTLW